VDSGLSRVLAPLWRRIELMLARGVVRLAKEGKCQYLQLDLLAGETRDGVERFEEYGYASAPLPGCEAAVLFVGGNRGHGIAVATADRRYRPTDLQPGETCLYTDEGDRITLRRGRIIDVVAGTKVKITAPEVEVIAATKVTVTTPLAEFSGNIVAAGMVAAAGFGTGGIVSVETGKVKATAVEDAAGAMSEMRQVFNGHKHSDPQGGTTGVPTTQMS